MGWSVRGDKVKIRQLILTSLIGLVSLSLYSPIVNTLSAAELLEGFDLETETFTDFNYVTVAWDSYLKLAQKEHLLDLTQLDSSTAGGQGQWRKINVEAYMAQIKDSNPMIALEENRLSYDNQDLTSIAYQFSNHSSEEMVDLTTVFYEDYLIYAGITFFNQSMYEYEGEILPLAHSITNSKQTQQEILLALSDHIGREGSTQFTYLEGENQHTESINLSFAELMVSVQSLMLTYYLEDLDLLSEAEKVSVAQLNEQIKMDDDERGTNQLDEETEEVSNQAEVSPLESNLSARQLLALFLPSHLEEEDLLEAGDLQKKFKSLQAVLNKTLASNHKIMEQLLEMEALASLTQAASEEPEPSALIYDSYGNPIQTDPLGNPVFFDVYGYPLQLDILGDPLLIDINQAPLQIDENGFPIFYNAYGNPYENDSEGNIIFYDANDTSIVYEREISEEQADSVELTLLRRQEIHSLLGEPLESVELEKGSLKDSYYALSEQIVILIDLIYVEEELFSVEYQELTPDIYLLLTTDLSKVNEWKEMLPLELDELKKYLGSPTSQVYFLGSNNYYVVWESYYKNKPKQIMALVEEDKIIDIFMNQ